MARILFIHNHQQEILIMNSNKEFPMVPVREE